MTTKRSLHYADVVGGDHSVVSSRITQDWHFVVLPMCIDLHVQAGDHVITCLLFHLPTFMARGPSRPAYHFLSALFAAVMARCPSSEQALRSRHSYHLPFFSFAHLFGARPERASFSLPFCPIMASGPSVSAYHCISVQFAPGMARGPS